MNIVIRCKWPFVRFWITEPHCGYIECNFCGRCIADGETGGCAATGEEKTRNINRVYKLKHEAKP